MEHTLIVQQLDNAANTLGVVAESTRQVVGQSLVTLGLCAGIVIAAAVLLTIGINVLAERNKRRRYNRAVGFLKAVAK